MQFVRQSKFRHVFVKPFKREFCMEDVRITKITWDSLFVTVNPKFIAIITEGSGGPFMVIPLNKVGRIDKDYPVVDAHRGPCLDIVWCPFNDNVIASSSEDCTTKIWHIPDGGLVRTLKEPIIELLGHQKRVVTVVWHPTAQNVLLTAGADMKIFIWNVGTGEALIEIAGHPDLIWSVDFNYNGSKIVTTCKDKKIRIIDPRTGKILQQGQGHEGVKPMRAIFLKDNRIFTTGFTKRSERMYALRDEEAIEEPIIQEELDTSNGVLYPLYDPDTGLLYLCGKGDSNIRYYEINNDPPFVHYINVYSESEPQRGIGFMPKRGLNITENEIARIYKVTNKGLIAVLQFLVPRKSELFQDDLYPDTKSTQPAISADEWMSGKDADPVLIPLRADGAPGGAAAKPAVAGVKKANILAQMPNPQEPSAAVGSGAAVKKSNILGQIQSNEAPAPQTAAPAPRNIAAEMAPPKSPNTASRISEMQSALQQQTPRASANDYLGVSASRESSRKSSPRGSRDSLLDAAPTSPRFEDGMGTPPVGGGARRSYDQGSGGASLSRRESGSAAPSSPGFGGVGSAVVLRTSKGEEFAVDDLIADVQKLKALVKRQERRIRFLEEQLQDKEIDFEGGI